MHIDYDTFIATHAANTQLNATACDDRWSFNVDENSWVIIKPNGHNVVTRKPK